MKLLFALAIGSVLCVEASKSNSKSSSKSSSKSGSKSNTKSKTATTTKSASKSKSVSLPKDDGLYCSDMTCFCNDDPCDMFQCNADKACTNSILVCESTSCPMECNGKQACKDAHIQCISDRCNLRCSADQSCYGLNSFHDTGLLTTANLEADGKAYGIWMSDRASTGKLICDGKQSCAKSDIGCAAGHCEVVCNGQQSCKESSVTTTEDSQGALVRCTEEHACQKATFDHSDTNGDVDVWCDNKQSCQDATIKCPAGHNCVVHCQGEHACQNLELMCPSSLPADKKCRIDCVGQKACQNTVATGAVCATCHTHAACSSALEAKDCEECTGTWMLTVPVVGGSCDSICVGVLDMDLCRQFCTCVQDTDAPATAAPLDCPHLVLQVPVGSLTCSDVCKDLFDTPACRQEYCKCGPLPPMTLPPLNCANLVLQVPILGVTCDDICTAVSSDIDACRHEYCKCGDAVTISKGLDCVSGQWVSTNTTSNSTDDCDDVCVDPDSDECLSYCECFVETTAPVLPTAAPSVPLTPAPTTPAPTMPNNCSKWELKVLGGITIPINCDSVCTGLIQDVTNCNKYCVCADTIAPVPTTAAPPVPATPAPTMPNNCSKWELKVLGGITIPINCDSVCTGLIQDVTNCNKYCVCADTIAPVPTTAPTPMPATPAPTMSNCSKWELKLIGGITFPVNCDSVCTGLIQDLTSCNQYCVCADNTMAPVPTTAPTPMPATPAPTMSNCSKWELKVVGGITIPINCDSVCTGLIQDLTSCNQYCVCADTDAPRALPTAEPTSAPATASPPTPVPTSNCSKWELKVVGGITIPINCDSVCTGLIQDLTSCNQYCVCADNTMAPVPTTAPTPMPATPAPTMSNCSKWELKVVGGITIPINCDSVCTGLIQDLTSCNQYCVCADTDAPRALPTAEPTSAPATASPPTPVPTSNCSNWALKLGGISLAIDCSVLCTGVVQNVTQCDKYCVCAESAAPSTLAPATAVPSTDVPATPVPGVRNILRRLIRITLRIIMALFNRTSFLRAVRRLLGGLVRNVQVHWTCPASACINGCPSSASRKIANGCRPLFDTTGRMAVVLESGEMVVEIETENSDVGSDAAVLAAFEDEAATPSGVFDEFPVQGATLVEAEVMVADEAEPASDDELGAMYIGIIVGVCVFAVIVLAVVTVLCMKKKQTSPQQHPHSSEKDVDCAKSCGYEFSEQDYIV